ncbi:MAG: sodium ion-translocating decarboxylase subunit beta, partial [Bacteroidaceae bacterium]|nr:sodium ion-translocating decarboxylase subunit beta [Bacteroidaceae bacterium]
GLYNQELWTNFMTEGHEAYHSYGAILREGGLLDFFYIGVKTSIYPCLIFMGVGAMTDFGPLLSNPKSLLLGAAAQMGVFAAFFGFLPGISLKYVEFYSILTLALHLYAIIKGAYKIIFAKKCIYVDIFLYLCALEFLPIAIVWKTILQLGDFITIKI